MPTPTAKAERSGSAARERLRHNSLDKRATTRAKSPLEKRATTRAKDKRPSVKTRLLTALALCLGLGSSGCVGTVYAVKASSAASKLEQAKVLGAEKYCPYEYYFAKANLLKAQEEAAQAAYGDAIDLAGLAQEYADKAIQLAQGTHRGAGR
jgi:hypothetical protein